MNELEQLKQRVQQLETLVNQLIHSDRYVFHKKVQVLDGRSIQTGKTNGTTIGTETTQKIAFHGSTPVIQANAISSPSGGTTVDSECRSAVSSILTMLRNKGLIAS